jgi:hypothetical protein
LTVPPRRFFTPLTAGMSSVSHPKRRKGVIGLFNGVSAGMCKPALIIFQAEDTVSVIRALTRCGSRRASPSVRPTSAGRGIPRITSSTSKDEAEGTGFGSHGGGES